MSCTAIFSSASSILAFSGVSFNCDLRPVMPLDVEFHVKLLCVKLLHAAPNDRCRRSVRLSSAFNIALMLV
jgi:hypothetical protein